MTIPPVEKICPRCQTRFFGRKNKVFCSEACKVDANNEKLKQIYHAQHGTSPRVTNKRDSANYTDKSITNNTNYSNRENELMAQNQRLQQEIQQLKQTIQAFTAAPGQATSNQAETDKQIKLEAARKQAEAQRIRILKLKEESDLKKLMEESEKEAVAILKQMEEEPLFRSEKIQRAEKEAKELLKQLDKDEKDNIQKHPKVVQAKQDAIASIRNTMEEAKNRLKGKQLADFLKKCEESIANLERDTQK